MNDRYGDSWYAVRSNGGRHIGVVHQTAPERWEGRYRNPAGREHTVHASSAVGVANLIIANVELCN